MMDTEIKGHVLPVTSKCCTFLDPSTILKNCMLQMTQIIFLLLANACPDCDAQKKATESLKSRQSIPLKKLYSKLKTILPRKDSIDCFGKCPKMTSAYVQVINASDGIVIYFFHGEKRSSVMFL